MDANEAQGLVAWDEPWLRACFGDLTRAMYGTDLGLFDLEILIAVIDDGVFWATGPDEADTLEQSRMTKDYRMRRGQPQGVDSF